MGWKILDIGTEKKVAKGKKARTRRRTPAVTRAERVATFRAGTTRICRSGCRSARSDRLRKSRYRQRTKPPKRFNDASLLTAMETAGKLLDDKDLENAMSERGLGTPATRAAILKR